MSDPTNDHPQDRQSPHDTARPTPGTSESAPVDRRKFIKSGLIAAGGAALISAVPRAADGADEDAVRSATPGTIPVRPFGKTGHNLPVLGLGGSAMVRRFITGYGVKLLPRQKRIAMVRQAFEAGVRYFDTARIYGESEDIYGRALEGVRDKAFIATKVHTTQPGDVRKSLETSLKYLRTDKVELIQIHSPAIEATGFDGAMKIHAELLKLKEEGLLKYIGLTTHIAFEAVEKMIDTGGFDQVLLAYGYFRKGMDTMLSPRSIEHRNRCLAKAHTRGMAIVAMKVFGASIFGHNAKRLVPGFDTKRLERLPGAAIRWVMRDPRVSMLNIGASLPGDVDTNAAILRGKLDYTAQDRALLADFCSQAYDAPMVKRMRTV